MRQQRLTAGQDGRPAGDSAAWQDSAASQDVALAVDGVSVRLGGRDVLRDVTFSIKPGEFVGLIGANGAGKTTLMRVILGLLQPAAGEVRVGGTSSTPRSADARRPRRGGIGYVPQKIQLDPDIPLRARDLVALGLDGQRLGFPLPSRSRRALVDQMLHAVDAGHLADARVGNLSGGEQQRIMIAHALISRPGLLLLDEPLANLDIANEQEVVALLARITAEQHIAVLISAHEMNPLLPVMDRIVYMAAGRAASGTTGEVIREDVLTGLYGRHVDVIRVHGRVLVVAGREDGLGIPADPAAAAGDDAHASGSLHAHADDPAGSAGAG
jgi:zinc/manganese transport system ATP-binding protein